MRISNPLIAFLGATSTVQAAALPDLKSLSIRQPLADLTSAIATSLEPRSDLEKRKGGGGGGRSGGSSSSGSGSGSSGSSGSSGAGAASDRTSGTSNTGGATSLGSGAPRSYGGGRYYGGGAATPYSAGARSPLGVAPFLIAAPALAFGGLWLYGAYAYPYGSPYSFRNVSRANTTNESLPVQCWCQQYQVCGCDDNTDRSYLDGLVGNGTGLNDTLIKRVNLNGTDTLVVNGSLPNGTTASGGTDDGTSAGIRLDGWASISGWWMMLAAVGSIVLYT